MIDLGIDPNTLLIYEAVANYGRGIWPAPFVTRAVVTSSAEKMLAGSNASDLYERGIFFREDASDPVARTRKGRFYLNSGNQPIRWLVSVHPASADDTRRAALDGRFELNVVALQSYKISEELKVIKNGYPLILLGDRIYFTPWSVLNIEMSVASQEIVTLRSRTTIGALPRLILQNIPQLGSELIQGELEKLSDEIYRASPLSTIDRCRDIATIALAIYLRDKNVILKEGADLSQIISTLERAPETVRKVVTAHATEIVRLFHARGKPAERERYPMMRGIHEKDAELAVLCVGTTLCDLGWATWD